MSQPANYRPLRPVTVLPTPDSGAETYQALVLDLPVPDTDQGVLWFVRMTRTAAELTVAPLLGLATSDPASRTLAVRHRPCATGNPQLATVCVNAELIVEGHSPYPFSITAPPPAALHRPASVRRARLATPRSDLAKTRAELAKTRTRTPARPRTAAVPTETPRPPPPPRTPSPVPPPPVLGVDVGLDGMPVGVSIPIPSLKREPSEDEQRARVAAACRHFVQVLLAERRNIKTVNST